MRIRHIPAALSLIVLAGTALAQVHLPDAYRYSIPDFDQRRQGLAGDGGSHCVPTSHSNLLAYIATHGFPLVFPNVTVPSAQSEHQDITNNIFTLGTYMGTTSANGTNGTGTQNGMSTWLGPFWILFSINYQHGPDVTPHDIYWDTQAGGLIAFCYGRWEFIPGNGRYERTGGGHCVSVKGLENYWFPGFPAGQYPTVAYRDPAADEGNVAGRLTHQSPFATTKYQLRPFTSIFKDYGVTSFWEMQTNSGDQYRRLLDGYTAIFPLFAMTSNTSTVQLHTPLNLLDSQQQMTLNLGNVIDVGFGVKPTHVFAITQSPLGGQARVHHANVASNEVLQSLTLQGSGGILAPGRRGEVYIFNAQTLTCLRPAGTSFNTEGGPVTITPAVDAMIYDDLRDGPTLIGGGQVHEFPRSLVGAPTIHSMSVTPVWASALHRVVPGLVPGDHWFGPLSGNVVRKYSLATDGSGRLVPTETVPPPGAAGSPTITDFSVGPSGHVMLVRNGALTEWWKNPATNQWEVLPGSPFHGMAVPGGGFHFSRSRTDFDPAIHDTPGWNIETDTMGGDPPTNSTADCLADVGRQGGFPEPDGKGDNNDFVVFIEFFFTHDLRADVGVQGGIPGNDGFFDNNDFVVFIDQFFTCG